MGRNGSRPRFPDLFPEPTGERPPSLTDVARERNRELLDAVLEIAEPYDAERRRLVSLFEQIVEDNMRVRAIADEASKGATESKWIARASLGVAVLSLVFSALPLLAQLVAQVFALFL